MDCRDGEDTVHKNWVDTIEGAINRADFGLAISRPASHEAPNFAWRKRWKSTVLVAERDLCPISRGITTVEEIVRAISPTKGTNIVGIADILLSGIKARDPRVI